MHNNVYLPTLYICINFILYVCCFIYVISSFKSKIQLPDLDIAD